MTQFRLRRKIKDPNQNPRNLPTKRTKRNHQRNLQRKTTERRPNHPKNRKVQFEKIPKAKLKAP